MTLLPATVTPCESCADTVGVLDGYCRDCSQAWELETCLHCGGATWTNVWGECGNCESDQYTQHREGVTQ